MLPLIKYSHSCNWSMIMHYEYFWKNKSISENSASEGNGSERKKPKLRQIHKRVPWDDTNNYNAQYCVTKGGFGETINSNRSYPCAKKIYKYCCFSWHSVLYCLSCCLLLFDVNAYCFISWFVWFIWFMQIVSDMFSWQTNVAKGAVTQMFLSMQMIQINFNCKCKPLRSFQWIYVAFQPIMLPSILFLFHVSQIFIQRLYVIARTAQVSMHHHTNDWQLN